MKYILVTGGVVSGIGKGIVTSSIGALLKACHVRVTAIKIDPYVNKDAGTFSPYEHGEVFVLNDGCEVDLDLGNYERFLDLDLEQTHTMTTGKIFQHVFNKERQGDYLGKTVQYMPDVTDAIEDWVERAANTEQNGLAPQVCLIELGGTIGDMESMHFIEALRQLQDRVNPGNLCCIHVSLVPFLNSSKELKSKPTQASVKTLKGLGLYPNMIVCRSQIPITNMIKDKISKFCGVKLKNVYDLPDLDTIYRVPIELERQGIVEAISEVLNLDNMGICDRMDRWVEISDIAVNADLEIIIALVGKYTALRECYTSVIKSLEHACFSIGARPKLRCIDSSLLESQDEKAWAELTTSHCLIVPGGFGIRGVEGKIAAIKWARENKLPFLGVCLGFQLAVVEYARSILGIENANSAEFDPDLKQKGREYEPIIIEMLEYKDPDKKMGGTMRLGLRKTLFVNEKSIMKRMYGNKDAIEERHRHRYEINPKHIEALEKAGLLFVGKNDDMTRMEILELDPSVHPYFVGVQFHPEFLSRPFRPSPPYMGLIEAARQVYQAEV